MKTIIVTPIFLVCKYGEFHYFVTYIMYYTDKIFCNYTEINNIPYIDQSLQVFTIYFVRFCGCDLKK